MKRMARYVLSASIALLLLPASSHCSEVTRFIIDEGRGVRDLVSLGDHIEKVYSSWGKPDRADKDDWPYATDMFCEYRQRGVLFASDKNGLIKGMTFYCNTGNKETFHKTGLMWINPSSQFNTFVGKTSKGLSLHDKLNPLEVYNIYGKPKLRYKLGEVADIRVIIKQGKPFIYDMGAAGYEIVYPNVGVLFSTFADMVESVSIIGK